jgi:hypothetical protein
MYYLAFLMDDVVNAKFLGYNSRVRRSTFEGYCIPDEPRRAEGSFGC